MKSQCNLAFSNVCPWSCVIKTVMCEGLVVMGGVCVAEIRNQQPLVYFWENCLCTGVRRCFNVTFCIWCSLACSWCWVRRIYDIIICSCPSARPLLGTMATWETCQLGGGYQTDAASSFSSQSHPLFNLTLPPPLVSCSPPYSPSYPQLSQSKGSVGAGHRGTTIPVQSSNISLVLTGS